LPKVKWFGQCDGEREREKEGGGREKDGGRKKEVKQEMQCGVGETERVGGRKRDDLYWQ